MKLSLELRCLLCLEWMILVGVGHQVFALGWFGAVVVTALLIVTLRTLVVLATWGFAACYASPAPPLGLLGWCQMVAREVQAYLWTSMVYLPFEPWLMPQDRLRPATCPILLVHGYGCSRGIWKPLVSRLESAGEVVATVSLLPPFGHIDDMVPQLAQRIDDVLLECKTRQVMLVAHSMGGLVCRDYLAMHGHGKVAGLITLATPHQGSELANLGIGDNAREMEPGSGWLQRFASVPLEVPAVSVRTTHDNFVMPQDRQKHDAMQDLPLPGVGHLSLLYMPALPALLKQCINELGMQKIRA